MAGLKEIRTRINSIASTQKITSAMKMVSAAKFHKAQETFFRFEYYSKKVDDVLHHVASEASNPSLQKWFTKPKSEEKVALVVLTSNSSMCAGFNQNLVKKVVEEGPKHWQRLWNTNKINIFCLGKKGCELLTKKGFNVTQTDVDIVQLPQFNDAADFCDQHLIKPFVDGKYDAVYIAYNRFSNPAVQVPTFKQFLPYNIEKKANNENADTAISQDHIFEPNKEDILKAIIPMSAKTSFFKLVLENSIGEHGARMTAMHQATENASELSKQLKLQYNKARQAAITNEILEIVSGAEALKG